MAHIDLANYQMLIVYRCYDNHEEESCFVVENEAAAKEFLDANPPAPDGYEDRPGYYFFEVAE